MPTFATDDGVDIHYHVDDFRDPWIEDEPETIVLHHGFIRSMRLWQQWVPALARRYRVVRFDVRGCGGSSVPPPEGDWSPARLVKDVRGLLNHLDLDRVHFVGHLSGALVGQLFAVTNPDRLRSLTLVAGPPVVNTEIRELYALGEEDSLASMERFGLSEWLRRTNAARFDATTDPRIVEWHLRQQEATPFHVAYRMHQAFRGVDMRDRLAEIAAPVLMIVPRGAPGTPPEQQAEMRAAIPNARLVILEGRGSDLCLTQADRCVDETLDFLAHLERPPSQGS